MDTRTIFFDSAIISVTLAFAFLFFQQSYSKYKCVKYWAAAFSFIAIGSLLFVLTGKIPEFFQKIVANPLLLLGYAFIATGLKDFSTHGEGKDNYWELMFAGLSIIPFYYYMVIEISLASRIIVFSFFSFVLFLNIAYLLFSLRKIMPCNTLFLPFIISLLTSLVCGLRMILTAIGVGIPDTQLFFDSNIITQILLIISIVMLVSLGVFLISFPGQRLLILVEKSREDFKKLSKKDHLTGLYNRLAITEFSCAIHDSAKKLCKPYSLLMVDIDHFKKVNDTYGHDIGDNVLKAVAKKITESFRHVDVKGRIGGEEFIVILPETGVKQAKMLADKLRVNISKTEVKINDFDVFVTVSIGVATYEKKCDFNDILRKADQALYHAKRNGRNQVSQYS